MAREERKATDCAAWCEECDLIFTFEERDIFVGEVYCPDCTGRVLIKHRAGAIRELRLVHRRATIYREPKPAARQK